MDKEIGRSGKPKKNQRYKKQQNKTKQNKTKTALKSIKLEYRRNLWASTGVKPSLLLLLLLFGHFLQWYINLRGLFNIEAILIEDISGTI